MIYLPFPCKHRLYADQSDLLPKSEGYDATNSHIACVRPLFTTHCRSLPPKSSGCRQRPDVRSFPHSTCAAAVSAWIPRKWPFELLGHHTPQLTRGPTHMPRSRYHDAEEDWLIVEYKCYAISSTHGHLAMTLKKYDYQSCKHCYILVSSVLSFRPPQASAAAWYTCCSSALEK